MRFWRSWPAVVCISETMVGAATGSRTAPKGGSAPEPLLCILLKGQPNPLGSGALYAPFITKTVYPSDIYRRTLPEATLEQFTAIHHRHRRQRDKTRREFAMHNMNVNKLRLYTSTCDTSVLLAGGWGFYEIVAVT